MSTLDLSRPCLLSRKHGDRSVAITLFTGLDAVMKLQGNCIAPHLAAAHRKSTRATHSEWANNVASSPSPAEQDTEQRRISHHSLWLRLATRPDRETRSPFMLSLRAVRARRCCRLEKLSANHHAQSMHSGVSLDTAALYFRLAGAIIQSYLTVMRLHMEKCLQILR